MDPLRNIAPCGVATPVALAKCLSILVLLLCALGPAREGIPATINRQLPAGFIVLGSAAASFGHHQFTIVALGERGEGKQPSSAQSTAARPLLLFERQADGSFRQVGRNDEVVMRADGGGQCDPFLDGGGVIAVKGRFFTVQNGVACGPQHWSDYVTFRFDDRRGGYVFDNERSESWSLNASRDPDAEAVVRDGPQKVTRENTSKPVPFGRWRPSR